MKRAGTPPPIHSEIPSRVLPVHDVGSRSLLRGILSGMVLKLDTRYPILWRSPSSVQVGSEGVAILDEVSDGDARLLAALAAGVSESGYAMMARAASVSSERADELLGLLAAALEQPTPPLPMRAAVLGDSALGRAIAGLLSASGALCGVEEAGLIVLVGDGVLAPADHTPWLSRDVPHVAVLAAETSVTVGPFVEPGAGPCLYCVHLARTDDDEAWPALATQLLGRAPSPLDPLARAEAASFVTRKVLERLHGAPGDGTSWRLDGRGGVSARTWARHPDCRCAAPPGTDWAAAPDRDHRGEPTTASVVGAPA